MRLMNGDDKDRKQKVRDEIKEMNLMNGDVLGNKQEDAMKTPDSQCALDKEDLAPVDAMYPLDPTSSDSPIIDPYNDELDEELSLEDELTGYEDDLSEGSEDSFYDANGVPNIGE